MGHHYVPQFYLRGFETDGTIWAYDKLHSRSFPTQVKSIANETGMYSDDLEAYLANEIEDPAKPAIQKIRSHRPLSPEDRLTLAKYIVILWKRTPKGRDRIGQYMPEVSAELRDDLHKELATLEAEHPDLASRIAQFRAQAEEVIARQERNPSPEIWHKSIESWSSPKVVDVLLSMNWTFLHSANAQFLTSDNPVFFFEHEGIGKQNSELSLPLSSSLALWASRRPSPSGRFLSALPAGVREINRRTAFNSRRFLYAARDEPWILPFATKKQWQLTRLRAKGDA